MHSFPLFLGCTLIFLYHFWIPPPQVLEQSPSLIQSDHLQSIGRGGGLGFVEVGQWGYSGGDEHLFLVGMAARPKFDKSGTLLLEVEQASKE